MNNLELLSIDDVACIFKISKETIKNWLYRPDTHAFPPGFPLKVDFMGLVRWRSSDINEFIKSLNLIPFQSQSKSYETKGVKGGRGNPRKSAIPFNVV